MIKILEKSYNCYMVFLYRLLYGNTSQNYDLLYDSILALNNNILDLKFTQYFENNLNCQGQKLVITNTTQKVIAWSLNSGSILQNIFTWIETISPSLTTYTIPVGTKYAYNYVYFSVPQDVNFQILNALEMVLYDSTVLSSDPSQNFVMAGTAPTSYGSINNVYRKKDIYNSSNPVTFKIKLF